MQLYHVMNRGVDKRTIVLDQKDRKRFVADLYTMNDAETVAHQNYYFALALDQGIPYQIEDRVPLVQVHAWCLVQNHYHLLVSEIVENGLSRFMHKLNMSYAKYFNERYERSGPLFQGTKSVPVTEDAHYLWIAHYIHFNPLDYQKQSADWRTQCIRNPTAALTALSEYRWSSYRDYINEKGFPEIVSGSFMYEERENISNESRRYLTSLSPEFVSAFSLE